MASVMNNILEFLGEIGLFDVILPFLLVYVMVFALLERTRLFGYDVIGSSKKEVTKKNLNSLFAFSVAFFAIMSSKVVGTLHRAIGPAMILLLCVVLFLMTVSIFEEEGSYNKFKNGKTLFIIIILVAIVLIFLASIQNSHGVSWLEWTYDYVSDHSDSGHVGAIFLLLIVVGLMYFIGYSGEGKSKTKDDD